MSGFNSGMNNIAAALVRRPQMQARNALYQAEAARNAAMIGEVNARTGLINTQAGDIQKKQAALEALAEEARGAITTDKQGRYVFDPQKAPNLTSALLATSKGGNDSAQTLGTFMKAGNSTMESDLDRSNKASIAAAADAERAARPVVAGNGSTVFSGDGSTVLGQAATTLAPGGTRLGPVDDGGNPAVEGAGVPLPAKSSAVDAQQARFEADAKLKMLELNKDWTPEQMSAFIKTGSPNLPAPPVTNVKDTRGIFARLINSGTIPVTNAAPATAGGNLSAVLTSTGNNAAPPQPAAPSAASSQIIPKAHIAYLQAHPDAAADFDAKYGSGASAKYLQPQ